MFEVSVGIILGFVSFLVIKVLFKDILGAQIKSTNNKSGHQIPIRSQKRYRLFNKRIIDSKRLRALKVFSAKTH